MLHVTPALVAGVGAAALFAGVSKSGFGSSAAFAALAILALVIPPGIALGLMLPVLMLIDLVTLPHYWRRWSWRDARSMALGAIPGVALGAWLYARTNADLFRILIGTLALMFVFWQVVQARAPLRKMRCPPVWVGGLAGLIAGFTSFVSHAGGPPATVYLLSRGLGKTAYQATTVLLFWAVNIAKFVPYSFLGLFTWQTLLIDLIVAPFALLGAWIGVRVHDLLPERFFFIVTYILLLITGGKLIHDGLT